MWEAVDVRPSEVAGTDCEHAPVVDHREDDDAANALDFDDYTSAAAPAASMDIHIPSNNIGYKLALKMGWRAGAGLGREGQGRTDPIRLDFKQDTVGLGRWEMEGEMAEKTTEKRRLLEAEMEITPELQQKWQAETEKKEAITTELKEVTRAFYCETCDKQYTKVTEFSNHLSSYDHHHTKRLKEMREREAKRNQGDAKKRQIKQEEKELKRLHDLANAMASRQHKPDAHPPPPPLHSENEAHASQQPLSGHAITGGFAAPPPTRPHSDGGDPTLLGTLATQQQPESVAVDGIAQVPTDTAPRMAVSFSLGSKTDEASRPPIKFGFGFKKK